MFLHEDKELFNDVLAATSASQNDREIAIIEKDYYITMILRLLSQEAIDCVFKGGTSLSKCHKIIDRFSEDIDIGFCTNLTQGQRKNLKNNIISGISNRLKLPITDWNNARSRRDYNCYTFDYSPVTAYDRHTLNSSVKMEVVLCPLTFPKVELDVTSYVYEYLAKDNAEIVKECCLEPFKMNVQSLERTFTDKVFAICDYYLQGKTRRNSRHIYDLYMLLPHIKFDNIYQALVKETRKQRATMMKEAICPSAQPDIDVNNLLKEIVTNEAYRSDYVNITSYFQNKPLEYDTAIEAIKKVIALQIF